MNQTAYFKNNKNLKKFSNRGFYKNIRCGILHQGETAGGWKILRRGKLLDDKTINSVRFLEEIKKAVKEYVGELKKSEWDSETWDKCRTKMSQIIKNSKP